MPMNRLRMKRSHNIIIRTIEGRRFGAALFVRWRALGICTYQGSLPTCLTTQFSGERLWVLCRFELLMSCAFRAGLAASPVTAMAVTDPHPDSGPDV